MPNRPFDGKDNDAEIEAEVREAQAPRPKSAFWSHPIVRIVVFGLIYFAISFLLNRVLYLIIPNPYVVSDSAGGHNPSSHAYYGVSAYDFGLEHAFANASAALFTLWLMKRSEGRSLWKSSGFVRVGAGGAILMGLLLGVAIQALCIGIAPFAGRPGLFGEYGSGPIPSYFFKTLFAYSLLASILRGLSQEIVFRGFIFQELERRWGTLVGLVVSSLLFCLFISQYQISLLFGRYNSYGTSSLFIVQGLAAGALFAGAYLWKRNLWLPISLHVGIAIIGVLSVIYFGLSSWNSISATVIQIFAAALVIYIAVRSGQWRSGPGPREIAHATAAGIVKIYDMTDPGKQADNDELPAPPAKPSEPTDQVK